MEPPAKKRGRGRKPKPKVEPLPKTDLDKGELSGNSDEVSTPKVSALNIKVPK